MSNDLVAPVERTFLFTDMESSTRAWDLDEVAMDAAQRRHDAILRHAISTNDGRIFATAGDGVAAAFTRADAAIAAAIDAQRGLLEEQWPTAAPVRVRMGLHTGSAIERDGDYFGPTVIRAARLMSLVEGGGIICSTATKAALPASMPGEMHLVSVGTVQLKGLSVPEPAHAVRAPGLPEHGVPIGHARPVWRRPRLDTSLVARDDEVAAILAQVAGGVLVSLVGVGGVGKTRVAAAVADRAAPRFDEQVAWIDLTTLSEASAVVHEVAGLLGVRAQRGEDLVDRVAVAIGDRDLMVVFDNCEHVLGAVRSFVEVLLQRCSGLAVMATSRERLGVAGERTIHVSPLPTGDAGSAAVELLIDRVGVGRDQLDANEVATLVDIAARLDGIPLALELAAARCRRLGIVEVGRRLPGHLDQLVDASRPSRHQTLEATIEWSYAMLQPAEQELLRSLAVFSATFDLDGVELVAGGEAADVDEIVASLLDKSLLERDGRRFRLLEVTRDFAGRRLDAMGERDAVATAHSRFVRARVMEIREGLHGREEAGWVGRLDQLWPDVRATVRRCLDDDDADAVTELVTHLAFEAFWRHPEAFTWIEEAAVRYGDRPGPHRHELLGAAGLVAWTQLDVPEGARLGGEAMALDTAPGTALDCLPECATLGGYMFSGRFEDAAAAARGALVHLADGSDRWNRAVMHANLAMALAIGGQFTPELDRELVAAIGVAHSSGNPTAIAYAHLVHAIATSVGDPAVSRAAVESARAYASEVDNTWVLSTAATTIAASPPDASPDEGAVALALAAADDLHRTGWGTHAWCALWGVVDGLFDLGRRETAAMVLGGCEASGVARLTYQQVPAELEHDDTTLARWRALGSHMSLDDLLTIASGRREPPLAP